MSGVDEGRILLHRRLHIVEAYTATAFPFFQEVESQIHRDLVDPGVKCRVTLEFSQRLIGAGENFLQKVVGVLLVGRHVVNQAVKFVAVFEDEGIESPRVPLLGARNEFLVGVRRTGLTKHLDGFGEQHLQITCGISDVKKCEAMRSIFFASTVAALSGAGCLSKYGGCGTAGYRSDCLPMWLTVREFEDIRYETTDEGKIAKITINRPEVRNAFRPQTVKEMLVAFDLAHEDPKIGAIILTGAGDLAFCSGGDQKVRGHAGYIGEDGVPRLNVLDLQKKIRSLPKPVVAMVAGYAIGGGHVLHIVCDLTIAADNARFGQTGPKVGSFDGGLGSSYLARIVGQKKAREIWYLCRQYDAQQALDMGLVNTVVPLADLEKETLQWCREMLAHSPLALRCLKSALNADCDGQMGLLDLAGNATLLYYMSEEGREGKQAFLEKRPPDFSKFPRVP